MNYFKQFLESSTIHGLAFISSTRKYSRLFWILVVFTGFSIASFLINDAFNNWEASPIKTTIETRPISEISFPKVTVCPPKNSFTDLSYDLKLMENMTMNSTSEKWKQLTGAALKELHDPFFEKLRINFFKLKEKLKLFNWYHGKSLITFPKFKVTQNLLVYKIETIATEGMIMTPNFGEMFDSNKVDKRLKFWIAIHIPEYYLQNENNTLMVELHWISFKDEMKLNNEILDQTRMLLNFTADSKPNGKKSLYRWHCIQQNKCAITFSLKRTITIADLNTYSLNTMPGFQLRWKWDQEREMTGPEIDILDYSFARNNLEIFNIRNRNKYQRFALEL